jgi:hypothetical protein
MTSSVRCGGLCCTVCAAATARALSNTGSNRVVVSCVLACAGGTAIIEQHLFQSACMVSGVVLKGDVSIFTQHIVPVGGRSHVAVVLEEMRVQFYAAHTQSRCGGLGCRKIVLEEMRVQFQAASSSSLRSGLVLARSRMQEMRVQSRAVVHLQSVWRG